MSYQIPLFPLNTVLFPGMPLHLHIFESRYKLMVNQLMNQEPVFGVALIRRGVESSGPLAEPHLVGTTARILKVDSLQDGCFNLTVVGDRRFRIQSISDENPYLTARVEDFPIDYRRPLDVYRRIRHLRNQVQYYLQTINKLENENLDLEEIQMPEDPFTLIFLAASLLQIPAHEKLPAINCDSALEIIHTVERLYRRENAVLKKLNNITSEQAQEFAYLN
ncbi:MAG TPA: LON peptidase substrate-binding domain-containing protein [Anaerolineaceae bacterium]|nr:LON peptidase substrate-binding domain-containing protein [Anaerolineaceae bacterium]